MAITVRESGIFPLDGLSKLLIQLCWERHESWEVSSNQVLRFWQISRLCFSATSAVYLILITRFLEFQKPGLGISERINLRTCLISVWLALIPSLCGLEPPTAFVVLNMLSFSTSFSGLFLHSKGSKIASFCRSCSVLSLLTAISVLVAAFLPSLVNLARASA